MSLIVGTGSLDPKYGTTSLGRMLQWIRMNRGERLYDMANKIGVGSAELSAYEFGRKRMGGDVIGKLISVYELDNSTSRRLIELAGRGFRKNCDHEMDGVF